MSEKNPTVSVIIPTYNRAHLIGRAIQSVLNQTYRDFEIIVVDDGSTDNTEEVIKSFSDERIRYIKHKENKGAAAARNTGIKTARGKFIAFQDSDDEWLPEKLEKQMKVFETAPPEVGIVYTGFWRFENNKKIYIPFSWVKQKEGNIHEELLKGNFIGTPAALVRKECFEKAGMFDEKLPGLEDWELFIRLSKYYNFKCVDEPLLVSYYTSNSISANNEAYIKTLKLILSKHFNDFAKNKKLLSGHYFSLGVNLYYSSGNFEEGKNYLIKAVKIHYLSCSPKGARYALNVKVVNKCSIIIPVFNNSDYIKQYLDVLYTVTPNHLFELIIVNNASTDGTKEFLNEFAKTYPNVKVIHNQENLGFAKACNQGARAAKGKYLVFLNNDTIPLKDWLEEMLKIIETEKNVGIVGSKLLYPNNTIQHAGVAIADFLQSICPYHIHRKSPADAPEVNVVKDYQAVTGACMLIPKELFDRLGGFDEGFLNGYEDVDLCFQVREAGYRVVYTPKSVLYHFESISEGRFKAEKENEKRLQEKWAGKIEPDVKVNYPKVSIVILNYNGWWDTIKCLESVYKSNYKKYQVIVVDNGSKIDNIEKFKNWAHKTQKNYIHCEKNRFIYPKNKFDKELVTIINKENLGFAGGNNVGIRYALKCGADYIWLLNNDTIIDKDALIELIKLAEIDKKIGMVSSKLYCYHDPKKVQYNGEKVVYEGMEDVKGELPKPTNFASGCSLLMRRKFIENVGLLDEDYFLYFEDNDISTRALKAGWKVYYNPYSKVYHKGGASVGGWLKTPLSVYYATRNLLLYHHKHDSLKILEIFDYLKYQFFPQLNGDRKKIYAFSQGIEDFIFKKKGKTDIDFKNISEIIKKIEREKSEIEESLKNLSEIGTKEKFYLIKNAFILKSDEYLNKFFNLAQVLFLKESYKKDKKEVDYYHQAEALYDNGQETEAIKLFKKTLELNPNFALAHNDLAYIYWRKKEIQKALHHLTKAMELDPDDRDIIWNCGQIMLGLGYAKDAYKVYKSYLKRHPGEKEIRQVVEKLEKGQIF